jgi:hypothetical protein
LVSSTIHEGPHYAVFYSLLLLPPLRLKVTAVVETKSGKNKNVKFGAQNHDDLLI